MKKYLMFFLLQCVFSANAIDQFCNGAPSTIHSNGGGYVALISIIDPSAYVGPEASVCEFAVLIGNVEVRDQARVYGTARLNGGTIVSGTAEVFGNAIISSTPPQTVVISQASKLYGNAMVMDGASIYGNAKVFENSRVSGKAKVFENALVYGNSTVTANSSILGSSKIYGRAYVGTNITVTGTANVCDSKYIPANATINDFTYCGSGTPIQIAAAGNFTCSLSAEGKVKCWGQNNFGQLGQGHMNAIGDNELPTSIGRIQLGNTPVSQIALGGGTACALLSNGKVRCWGLNNAGQLGQGHTSNIGDSKLPSSVPTIQLGTGVVSQLALGYSHVCALFTTGSVKCWGDNSYGQLGLGNTNHIGDNELPSTTTALTFSSPVVQIAAGGNSTCAILSTGDLRCWGMGSTGQLGYGNALNIGDDELATTAGNVSIGGTAIQVSLGDSHTCVLLSTGVVRCWGTNTKGQIGTGNTNTIGDNELPTTISPVAGLNSLQIYAGGTETCAKMITGELRCWGEGTYGQLGYANTTTMGDNEGPSVNAILLGGVANQVAVGGFHVCSLLVNDSVKCWGYNFNGQLGLGNTNNIGDNEFPQDVGTVNHFSNKKSINYWE